MLEYLYPLSRRKKMVNNYLLGYRHPAVGMYIPKVNRKKQLLLLVAFVPFFVTFGTNWLYFLGLQVLFKLNPLFIYQ